MLEERAAQWKDEYIRQGMMIGKTEGIGLVLQDLLEARFGALPQFVTTYIADLTDVVALRKLTLFAYRAETIQAFMEALTAYSSFRTREDQNPNPKS